MTSGHWLQVTTCINLYSEKHEEQNRLCWVHCWLCSHPHPHPRLLILGNLCCSTLRISFQVAEQMSLPFTFVPTFASPLCSLSLSLSLNSVWTHLMSQWIFCELEYKTVLEQATSVGNTGGNMSHFTPFNFLCLECFYTIFWGSSPFSSLFFTRSNGWYEWRIDVLLKCIK